MTLIVYTKTRCPWCRDVLYFLNAKKVPFEEREVRNNQSFMDEMVAKSGQSRAPTLDLDGAILADTDAPAVEKWLKEKKVLSS